jgi:hypothetical protein
MPGVRPGIHDGNCAAVGAVIPCVSGSRALGSSFHDPCKAVADFAQFDALDIRIGRIVKVEDAQTRKPTYPMTVDFGPEIGPETSCGAHNEAAESG